MIDYSYLKPPRKVFRTKLPLNYIYECIDGSHKRRIFNRPQYEQFEKEAIKKLKDYLQMKSPNIHYDDQLLLRFIYSGNFMLSEITEKVKIYEEWHQNQIIVNLNKIGRSILENGHFYAFGRDYDYCPIIIVKPAKIDRKKYHIQNYFNAVANILDLLEKYMLVGGVIQKWNILVDFQGKKLKERLDSFEYNLNRIIYAYPCRLKRIFYVNVNQSYNDMIAKVSEQILIHDKQIHAQIIKDFENLSKYFSTDEREIKYGGTLPNVCEYWPIHTTNKYEQTQSEYNKSEYESAINDFIYFQESKTSFCDFKSCNCSIY